MLFSWLGMQSKQQKWDEKCYQFLSHFWTESTIRASDSPATYGALQMCFDWLIDFCLFCKNLWKAVQFILLITYLCSFFLLIAIGQVDNKLCIRMCNFLKYWNISWGREQLLSRSSPVCSTPYPLRGLLHSCCSFRLTFSPFQRRACTVRFIWSKESMEAILAGCHWIQTIA